MSNATKRLFKEYNQIMEHPIPHLTVGLDKEDLLDWKLEVQAPDSSPYKDFNLKIQMTFPIEYPFKPPCISFKSKIYHPNVSQEGKVCMSMLKTEEWKPATKLNTLLTALVDLIVNPNPDDPLNSEAAMLFKSDYTAFCRNVAEKTCS